VAPSSNEDLVSDKERGNDNPAMEAIAQEITPCRDERLSIGFAG